MGNPYQASGTGKYQRGRFLSKADVAAGEPFIPVIAAIINLPQIQSIAEMIGSDLANIEKRQAEAEKRNEEIYRKLMSQIRGSYMIVSGLVRVMGSGMSRIFQGIWSIAVSAIATYKSIAAAMAATPGGQAQALLMFTSLIMASINVGALITGQTDLARQARGLNFTLHGISSMISYVPTM